MEAPKATPPGLEAELHEQQIACASTPAGSPGEREVKGSGCKDPIPPPAAASRDQEVGTFGGDAAQFSLPQAHGADYVTQDALLQQIEAANGRLAQQLQKGFAAAKAEISALRTAVLPAQGADQSSQEALLQQIEAANARLAQQLREGFAAAKAEIGALSTAVLPAQGADQARRDALLQQIEAANARLAQQLREGFAAA